jgi:uncharacterized protein (TIGR02453 family)
MKHSLSFLKELAKNNTREWFDIHRKDYEQSKKELSDLTGAVIQQIALFDSSIGALSPKDCIFRIFRDTRFSANKTPYKINIGASFSDGGKKSPKAGYYLHIQPGNSFLAGGIYMPEAERLNAIRQEIYFNHENLRKILAVPAFKKAFGGLEDHQLKTNPKGFDKEHPAIDLLRYKSYIVVTPIKDADLSKPDFAEQAGKTFKLMYPLIQYLNGALSMAEK